MDKRTSENGSKSDVKSKAFLEMVPSAAIIWNSPQTVCALNQSAQRLIGFSEADLMEDNRFWSKSIYCADRTIFNDRQKKMERGTSEITCDYRFYPKGMSEPIRIREVIILLRDPNFNWRWISMYSDISELEQSSLSERRDFMGEEMREIIGNLFHEIKNRLHLLNMELELAVLEAGDSLYAKKFAGALHELNHSIQEMHDYLVPGRNGLPSRD
jgi:hypothetical protein